MENRQGPRQGVYAYGLEDIDLAAEAKISPDDLMITIYEAPGVNFSFGQGEAQRANAVARS
jgi:hypothetical protein